MSFLPQITLEKIVSLQMVTFEAMNRRAQMKLMAWASVEKNRFL